LIGGGALREAFAEDCACPSEPPLTKKTEGLEEVTYALEKVVVSSPGPTPRPDEQSSASRIFEEKKREVRQKTADDAFIRIQVLK
jgi:hypothetical protein